MKTVFTVLKGLLRPMLSNWLSLSVLATIVASSTSQQAMAIDVPEATYTYQLEIGKGTDVCEHMQNVFNTRFNKLWNAPALDADDPAFSADGKYSFPRLPGIEHDYRKTFEMRFSKAPSSPEFDAIQWREGRAIIGGPQGADIEKIPGAKTMLPILVAEYDFDNDGQIDTVLKEGFSKGYSYMANGRGNGLSDEYLMVWRGKKIELQGVLSLWTLENEVSETQRPVVVTASYERPFIYKGHSYAAQYDIDLGGDYDSTLKPPYKPIAETMSVLNYRFSGGVNKFTHQPEWDTDTVCKYTMKQVSN